MTTPAVIVKKQTEILYQMDKTMSLMTVSSRGTINCCSGAPEGVSADGIENAHRVAVEVMEQKRGQKMKDMKGGDLWVSCVKLKEGESPETARDTLGLTVAILCCGKNTVYLMETARGDKTLDEEWTQGMIGRGRAFIAAVNR